MTRAIAVTIGLNAVDPAHYQGWSGVLYACEADAESMAGIATQRGFAVTRLIGAAATRAAVCDRLDQAASSLKEGDILLLTYSGHGGQVPDENGDEPDGVDETWCLYDGQLLDDEVNARLARFARGVRVVAFSDSCHSGTMLKQAHLETLHASGPVAALQGEPGAAPPRLRYMPPDVAVRTYRANRAFYDPLIRRRRRDPAGDVAATALLISGCQDNQTSADGTFHGLFTANLLRVWHDGSFKGGYRAFHRAIGRRMPPTQTPNYVTSGTPWPAFERQEPFTAAAPG